MSTVVMLRNNLNALVYFNTSVGAKRQADTLADLHHTTVKYHADVDVYIVDANEYYKKKAESLRVLAKDETVVASIQSGIFGNWSNDEFKPN